MSRIRSVKPEFWTSEQNLQCSRNTRLLFIGLWNFCDDAGRHPYSAKQAKAEVFPGDDDLSEADILGMLQELSKNGLITIYAANGKEYFVVNGWHHQRIDKPQKPKYPEPLQDNSKNDPGTFPPDTIGYDTKGEDTIEPSLRSPAENASRETSPSSVVYFFESGVIRLSEKDFKKWEQSFANLDLRAELISLTQWANDQGQAWFFAVSGALAKRNRDQKVRLEQARASGGGYAPAIPGII